MDKSKMQLLGFGMVALLWLGVLSLSGTIAASAQGGAMVGLGIAAFICAAIATGWILFFSTTNRSARAVEPSKRKNDSDIDPMSLLTDDDIAELREAYKDVVRRRMLEDGADGEIQTLDELLTERDQHTRRK